MTPRAHTGSLLSHGRASVATRSLWLLALVLSLAAVAAVDVDGDPTTSNVTSVVVMADGAVEDVAVADASSPVVASVRLRRGYPRAIAVYLLRVRSLWAPRTRSIRGP
jgi:hypothetical protein